MKISYNWLKTFLTLPESIETTGEILTSIGLEVESIEKVESIPGGLSGVVVGHVLTREKHPDADKLSLTTVDVGGEEPLSIVCGAPNVAAGQKVLVATIGATLHPTEGEPFQIKKSKIRGAASEGMICALDELGLGSDHSGIVVLPEETPIGTPAARVYNLESDYVYEIGLTPNRSDATCHLGVAQDLAAALRINHQYTGQLCIPTLEGYEVKETDNSLKVTVENTEACPRYCGVVIKGLQIAESPAWLKQRLNAIGVRSINNVVDATNYVLHELGQPLHAFDLSAIQGNQIRVKTLPAGTTFLALDETERKLTDTDLMICDGQDNPMCIGGVFGGLNSGVSDKTTAIFLESAHFSASSIRRSSMHHLLRTDAAKVFEKGSDPNMPLYALQRAAILLQEVAGGYVASDIVDIYPAPVVPRQVDIRLSRVNELIGSNMTKESVQTILDALNMPIVRQEGDTLTVQVPTNKSDVLREVDIIEEILRIYGFNQVGEPGYIRTATVIAPKPDPGKIRDEVAQFLAANGFHEMMAVSLSESKYYEKYMPEIKPEQLVYINNTSNVHLDIMRAHMLPSGLEAIVHNQNRQQSALRLFEFGKTYQHSEKGIVETPQLTLFMSGEAKPESWHNPKGGKVNFYTLKSMVDGILQLNNVQGYQDSVSEGAGVLGFGLSYHRGSNVIAEFGKVQSKITQGFGIKGDVFYASLNWEAILQSVAKAKIKYQALNRFPTVRRDLALVVDKQVTFRDISTIARQTGGKLLTNINLFDVYENESQLGAGKKSYAVSYFFENPEKTLTDQEIDGIQQKLIAKYTEKLGALIRQ